LVIRKFVAALAVSTALVLGTAGCSLTHDVESLQEYAPSDGAQATSNGVKALNVIYLTETLKSGWAGNVVGGIIGSFVNTTDKPVTITLSYNENASSATDVIAPQSGSWTSEEIAPGSKYDLGYNENAALSAVLLDELKKPVLPGDLVTVWMSVDGGTPVELRVPALDGTLEQYTGIVQNLENANAGTGE
jgi:hypothetical protein